jgi:hypothetical protein
MFPAANTPEIVALTRLATQDPIFLTEDLTYSFDMLRPWDFLRLTGLVLTALLAVMFFSVRSTLTNMFLLKWKTQRQSPSVAAPKDAWHRDAWTERTFGMAVTRDQDCILIVLPCSQRADWFSGPSRDVKVVDVAASAQQDIPVPSEATVVLDRFEYGMSDESIMSWKLTFLERLLSASKKIFIVTTIDPVFWIENAEEAATRGGHADIDRWAHVLSRFDLFRMPAVKNCTSTVPYYRLLWSSCTLGERIALLGLVEHGWPNYKNYEALHHLWNRGLIEADPEFRVSDSGFADYLSGTVTEAERRFWRSHDPSGIWDGVRTTLIVLLLGGLAAFLFFSQKDTLGLVTGAIGAITAATKIIADLKSGTTRGKSGSEAA